jgi:hypothetical protein
LVNWQRSPYELIFVVFLPKPFCQTC